MGFELEALIAGLIVGAIAIYYLMSKRIAGLVEIRANEMGKELGLRLFQNQKTELVNTIRQATQQEDQQRFNAQLPEIIKQQRDDAVSKQRDVVKGKITEQLAPLLPLFQKICPNFAEARFLGSPIDYVIFRNLHKTESNEPLEIILLDIKLAMLN